jgi:carbon-monoxide dehydrogenase small subunit
MLRRATNLGPREIRHHLTGNICRCTGYHNIIRAVEALAFARAASDD